MLPAPDGFKPFTAGAVAAVDPPPRDLIIASPANPTGTIIAASGLRAIVEVRRDLNISIISDEIYHGLSYIEPAMVAGGLLAIDRDGRHVCDPCMYSYQ